jgi:hypothetical protein
MRAPDEERANSRRVVPLQAGAGPDNPPCPACGEPLFGWLGAQPGLGGTVRRCESCGLAVVGEVGDAQAALEDLDSLRRGEALRIANRASFGCSLGGPGWAGLAPGTRHLFTAESVRCLVGRRDQVVASTRWAPLAGLALTWQTLLNSVTFGRNVGLALLGRAPAVPAPLAWQRRIDALATVVLALPALVIALPVELAGAPFGRGASLSLRLELL